MEDFPVMPYESTGFMLKPDGFFLLGIQRLTCHQKRMKRVNWPVVRRRAVAVELLMLYMGLVCVCVEEK